MAYRRGGYWYRSRRNGPQVETEYLGAGDLGELSAYLDAAKQEERREEREAMQALRDEQAAIDRQLDAAGAALGGLVGAILEGAGYHKHKGTWRKRRYGQGKGGGVCKEGGRITKGDQQGQGQA